MPPVQNANPSCAPFPENDSSCRPWPQLADEGETEVKQTCVCHVCSRPLLFHARIGSSGARQKASALALLLLACQKGKKWPQAGLQRKPGL